MDKNPKIEHILINNLAQTHDSESAKSIHLEQ